MACMSTLSSTAFIVLALPLLPVTPQPVADTGTGAGIGLRLIGICRTPMLSSGAGLPSGTICASAMSLAYMFGERLTSSIFAA